MFLFFFSHTMNQHKSMRTLHNKIKQWCLGQPKHRACYLLDIACGRGGDIQKWHACGIRNVVGLDVNPEYVQEAKRRLAQLTSTQPHYETNDYKFYAVAETEDIPAFLVQKAIQHRFDTVTCHFAIHYFFESETKIRNLLSQVSKVLHTGGFFMCTAMNGNRVKSLGSDFKNTAMIVHNTETESDTVFGAPVEIHITGTLYFGECSFSREFLVCPETLIRLCGEYGLWLKQRTPFKDFQTVFSVRLDPDTRLCSELYESFVFEKQN